jgi:tetratricopeptide (TPR) repeat protein
MPFSNRPEVDARNTSNTQPAQTVLQERYTLRRCMAESALGKLYWAQDLQQTQANGEQANVLIFTVTPALAQQAAFEQALRQVLPAYQRPAQAMPLVKDNGTSGDGTRWFAIQNVGGMLLSERLQELDERGMPINDAMQLLDTVANALAQFRPDGVFGFLEPGTTLLGDDGIRLLTAPIASALRLLKTGKLDMTMPTLHSGYISPEVLLGHLPLANDDTFSIACLTYHLLKGEMPYGKYSTLEAAVRNVFPTSSHKLRQDAWNVLQQGLSLQRAPRPVSPTAFLRTLQNKQHNRWLLPATALVAASAMALTTYYVISSWNKPEPVPATALSPLTAPTTITPSTATLPDSTPNALPSTTAPTDTTLQSPRESVDNLLQQANDALHKGNVISDDSSQPAALDYLRQIYQQEPDNATAQTLLAQLIDDQQAEAETLLLNGRVDAADKLLQRTDKLITEFSIADGLKRQVALESKVEQQQRQAALGTPDSTPDSTPSSSTITTPPTTVTSTTNSVPSDTTITPNNSDNPDDWAGQAKTAQEQALAYLQKGNTVSARTALDTSQGLIGKYSLDSLVEEQLALEQRLRETRDNMGIFPAGDEPEKATATRKPSTHNNASIANDDTRHNSDVNKAKDKKDEKKDSTTVKTTSHNTEKTTTTHAKPAANPPPEPAAHAPVARPAVVVPAHPTQPTQYVIPAQAQPVRPAPRPPVVPHTPPAQPAHTAKNANTNVPDLMEVPLNMITTTPQRP